MNKNNLSTQEIEILHPMEKGVSFSFTEATTEDIPQIRKLSYAIWPTAFKDILSRDQMEYMLDWMYSEDSLKNQMGANHHFLLLKESSESIGYCSFQFKEEVTLLHKIYLLPHWWGKSLGKMIISEVTNRSLKRGVQFIQLNVNRHNKAVLFYKKMGFQIVKEMDNPIGKGYFMNDYVMKLRLSRKE